MANKNFRVERARPVGNTSNDFPTRSKPLLDVEGWYEATSGRLPQRYQHALEAYRASSSTLKFTRWLARNHAEFSPADIAEVGKILATDKFSFKLSCRHQDLLRIGETKHYSVCTTPGKMYDRVPFCHIADPDMAVLYVPDKAGNFQWRALVRLMVPEGSKQPVLAMYRVYGSGSTEGVLNKLSELMPVYLLYRTQGIKWLDNDFGDRWGIQENKKKWGSRKTLFGYHMLNNISPLRTMFSDHPFGFIGTVILKEREYTYGWASHRKPLKDDYRFSKRKHTVEDMRSIPFNNGEWKVIEGRVVTKGFPYAPGTALNDYHLNW